MTETMDYECPRCHGVVSVPNSAIGTAVTCPNCQQRFQASLPIGRPIESNDKGKNHRSENKAEQTVQVLHPVVFRSHLFLTSISSLILLASLFGLVMWLAGRKIFGMDGTVLLIVSLMTLVVAVGALVYEWIRSLAIKLTVTTQRSIVEQGIITKRTSEVKHDDVRNIQCNQNLIERMLNYGDLSLSSAGQDDMEIVVRDIPDPHSVIELIRRYQ